MWQLTKVRDFLLESYPFSSTNHFRTLQKHSTCPPMPKGPNQASDSHGLVGAKHPHQRTNEDGGHRRNTRRVASFPWCVMAKPFTYKFTSGDVNRTSFGEAPVAARILCGPWGYTGPIDVHVFGTIGDVTLV